MGYLKWSIASELELSGHEQCPFNGLGKNGGPHVVYRTPQWGYCFPLGFVKVMQYPFQSFKRYAIHPKAFLRYLDWAIVSSFNFFGHEQYGWKHTKGESLLFKKGDV